MMNAPKLRLGVMLALTLWLATPSHATDIAQIFGHNQRQVNQGDQTLLFQADKAKFLPVHEAFAMTAVQKNNELTVSFDIKPNHYIYQDKLALVLVDGLSVGEWRFNQAPVMIDDPDFGHVPVFKSDFSATATLSASQDIEQKITVRWQGCAEAGLCYPPQKTAVHIQLSSESLPFLDGSQSSIQPKTQSSIQSNAITSEQAIQSPNVEPTKALPTVWPKSTAESTQNVASLDIAHDDLLSVQNKDATLQEAYLLSHSLEGVHNDPFGFAKNPWLAVILLFLAGLVLAFSACIYPMIPIVANIVARSHNPSPWRGFLLTLAYALGVASSYGLLGALVAWFGRALGIIIWLQNPQILFAFAVVFVLLALHMMGLLTIRLPSFVSQYLSRMSQKADHKLGSLGGSYLVGALSALVVSPCVSAPLGGALVAIAIIGDVLLGFVALFALGMGVSLPLILMGMTQAHFMPKTGAWMVHVKYFGGLMLLGVAILLLNRIYLQAWMTVVWAIWFALVATFLWRLVRLPFKMASILFMLWSAVLLIGVATNKPDPWRPWVQMMPSANSAIHISTLKELDLILAKSPQVLVDVTADWCIECRIMERTLFANPPSALASWQVVKLDVSQSNEDSQAILARYDLFGPPALLFYQKGQLMNKQIGEVKRDDFEEMLEMMNTLH